ncbi:FAD binding domain-containing protein [Sulfitobacter mediterraneus]|uniref:FAD binding domain-containing protein n=1 Tax=Sulfitobacter mediterraneus TaxID=83219 RepID=UPI0024920B40|nr:xanthine dehydrogenase family protein subunit M [Sulfitobacter mediterraneus]
MSYHNPTDLASALETLTRQGGKIVAGGTDVYPSAKQGQQPTFFLDVTGIAGLYGISRTEAGYRFGAATTWTEILNADLPPAFHGLKSAAAEVGSIQIQNAGTIAGNLCNASPAADGVPPLLTLDAQVELTSAANGVRILPLSQFITGARQTALAPEELLTAVLVPEPPQNATSAFEKLGSRRYLVISITMTACLICLDTNNRITEARIAVGACSPVARRLHDLEQALIGKTLQEVAVEADHLAPLTPIDDVRGSADYRLDVVAEQIRRAIQKAAA